jgi:hypothetical protein
MLLPSGVGETQSDMGGAAENDTALPLDPILFGEHSSSRTTTTKIASQTTVDGLPKITTTAISPTTNISIDESYIPDGYLRAVVASTTEDFLFPIAYSYVRFLGHLKLYLTFHTHDIIFASATGEEPWTALSEESFTRLKMTIVKRCLHVRVAVAADFMSSDEDENDEQYHSRSVCQIPWYVFCKADRCSMLN